VGCDREYVRRALIEHDGYPTDIKVSPPRENRQRYCKPWNAGLASETSSVEKRISRLLEALSVEINSNLVQGDIVDDIYNFRVALWQKLKRDGWEIKSRKTGSKPIVKAPRS